MKVVFLVLSIALTIASAFPYMRDILRGSTKPNVVSWFTWTLLTAIATSAAITAGEYSTALFTGAATIETLMIVILAIGRGYARYHFFDIICQLSAVVGIILWQVFDSPSIAVVAVVAIDLIGALPTLRHIIRAPSEETYMTYGLAAAGGIFALCALMSYNWVTLPYAIYIVVINIVFTSLILRRSGHKQTL